MSNSPWILGAPHNGLAKLISRISRRISNDTVVSAAAASRFPAPIRSEARAVPSYNRVQLNDRKRTTGLRKQPVKTNANQSVIGLKASLRSAPRRSNLDLLPQDQNLGLKRSSRPESSLSIRLISTGPTSRNSITRFSINYQPAMACGRDSGQFSDQCYRSAKRSEGGYP